MLSEPILREQEGDNDGLVSVKSAKWGEYLGQLRADHAAQIGHFFGLPDYFDYRSFYRSLATKLTD